MRASRHCPGRGKTGREVHLQCAGEEDEGGRFKVKGVELQDGREFVADIFVGNADLPYIYKELLPENKRSEETREQTLHLLDDHVLLGRG
jgi:hypothetical protein